MYYVHHGISHLSRGRGVVVVALALIAHATCPLLFWTQLMRLNIVISRVCVTHFFPALLLLLLLMLLLLGHTWNLVNCVMAVSKKKRA